MIVKTIDLGWCVGKLVLDSNGVPNQLHIISPSEAGENAYKPAESVMIYCSDNIRNLYNALVEVYHVEAKP